MCPFSMTVESRRHARLVGIGVFCVYLATAGGGLTSVDAVTTYEVAKNLVTQGSWSLDVPRLNHYRGLDGRFYSPFGIGQSVFDIPFFIAGRGIRQAFGLRIATSESVDKAAVALGSTVAAAGLVWTVYLFAWGLSG